MFSKKITLNSSLVLAALALAPDYASACWHGSPVEGKCVYTEIRELFAKSGDTERVTTLVEAAVARANQKTSQGQAISAIPAGTTLEKVEVSAYEKSGTAERVSIYLKLPQQFTDSAEHTRYRTYLMGGEFLHALLNEGHTGTYLYFWDEDSQRFLEPDEVFPLEPMPVLEPVVDEASMEMSKELGKPATRDNQKKLPVINPGQPTGSLSGKTIFINQSHGWFDDYTSPLDRYRVQRGDSHGTLEDFDSAEFMNLYVLPALRNAGAKVMTVRESDHQTNMVIVDNSDGVSNPANGTYVETGTWANSSLAGFVQKTGPSWNGVTINPFNQGSGQNRLSSGVTTGAPTATATWTAVIPEDGFYNVYASWTAFSARANDAQYFVHHSGGVSEVRMDQTIDGITWVLLGNWYFEAGAPENERKVVLTNSTTDASATNVSADAVRWGGGMGDFARHSGGNGISGRPRWEEEAVLYLQFNGMGASGSHYTGSDDESGGWSDRPQYARWEHSQKDASVEDALYIAWHTNAFNGTARGLSSFRHSSATAASITFQNILHNKIYNAVNTLWFTGETWTVRGKNETNFGENNQASLGTGLPGFLLEGLFHDNVTDSTAYNEPEFRRITARAITQGIIDYFAQRDTISLAYPPETPQNFRVIMQPNGTAQLSWSAGPAGGFNGASPTGYKVYRSSNGFGFDDGTAVAGTTTNLSSIPTNEPVYFRVAAVNSGGESFPTETLAAKRGSNNVLIVNGFDRNQRSQIPTQNITNAGTALRRHEPHTFQAFNYIIEHAEALKNTPVAISSTSNEPVESAQVALGSYDAVFWIAGEESTGTDAITATEQSRIAAYLSTSGKNFFISGAEVGYDLGRSGISSAGDLAFWNNTLFTTYVGDDSGTYNVTGTAAPFASLGSFNFNPSVGARYDAEFPDRFGTIGGSTSVLSYVGGTGDTAGVAFNGASKVINLGFPFETISSEQARQDLMEDAVEFFGLNSSSVRQELFMIY